MMDNVFNSFVTKYASRALRREHFQAISLHYYASLDDPPASIGFTEQTWEKALDSMLQMEKTIAEASDVMDKYDPQKEIALAIDEWALVTKGEITVTLLNAESAALALNIFNRHSDRVRVANMSYLLNTANAAIQTDGDKMLLTPVYYVLKMYKPFKGATACVVRIAPSSDAQRKSSLPRVDISAAKTKDSKVYLAMVNLDPQRGIDVVTNLSGKADAEVLTGPSMDAHNGFLDPNAVHPAKFVDGFARDGKLGFRLPARSVVVAAVR